MAPEKSDPGAETGADVLCWETERVRSSEVVSAPQWRSLDRGTPTLVTVKYSPGEQRPEEAQFCRDFEFTANPLTSKQEDGLQIPLRRPDLPPLEGGPE